jgi:glutamate-ammonia-ligase adenylyltransferase
MKGMITRQVDLNEMSHDLKLGSGGIREIEFIAQAISLSGVESTRNCKSQN